jgi:hypothetical protein
VPLTRTVPPCTPSLEATIEIVAAASDEDSVRQIWAADTTGIPRTSHRTGKTRKAEAHEQGSPRLRNVDGCAAERHRDGSVREFRDGVTRGQPHREINELANSDTSENERNLDRVRAGSGRARLESIRNTLDPDIIVLTVLARTHLDATRIDVHQRLTSDARPLQHLRRKQNAKREGQALANNWDDLTDGTLAVAVQYAADGTSLSVFVYTNTNLAGDAVSTVATCSDWTSTDGIAPGGDSGSTDGGWTNRGIAIGCVSGYIYCFED